MPIQSLPSVLKLPTRVWINTNYSSILCTGLRVSSHFTQVTKQLPDVNDFWSLPSDPLWVSRGAHSWKDLYHINKRVSHLVPLLFPFTNPQIHIGVSFSIKYITKGQTLCCWLASGAVHLHLAKITLYILQGAYSSCQGMNYKEYITHIHVRIIFRNL